MKRRTYFTLCLPVLIAGYFIYGRFLKRSFGFGLPIAMLLSSLCLPFARQHELTLAADIIGLVTPSAASEYQFAAGAEYRFHHLVSLLGGYHSGNPDKGTSDYFTLGGGFSLHDVELGVAWLTARDKHNPLDRTLTFTLAIGLDRLMK